MQESRVTGEWQREGEPQKHIVDDNSNAGILIVCLLDLDELCRIDLPQSQPPSSRQDRIRR